ncbi:MAG: hypothetical protein JXR05_08770 [Flavobacteriaceae bacterium]
MGKNLIHVTIIFFGGILLLGGVAKIQKVILILFSEEEFTVKVDSFVAYLLFSFLGFYLVRLGYRKMYPSEDEDSIEDIGMKK